MAEQRQGRPGKPSGHSSRGAGKSTTGARKGARPLRDGDRRTTGRGRPEARGTDKAGGKTGGKRGAGKTGGAPDRRTSGRGSRPAYGNKPAPAAKHEVERTADQRAYDGPDLPPEITGKELDRQVAAQLRGLPEKLAARVARHLVAAGMYIEDNPELAYQHAKAAKARTQRIAVIREAMGEAAYAAGHYSEALAELRAAKRMNGATAYLPIMADCHRALGQPQQAIKLAHSPSVANFAPEAKAEMTIVEAGARRDMGQLDAALRILEQAPLHSKSRAAWVVRLRYAYADALEAAHRDTDALAWFHRTHAIDGEQITDAEKRAATLEGRLSE